MSGSWQGLVARANQTGQQAALTSATGGQSDAAGWAPAQLTAAQRAALQSSNYGAMALRAMPQTPGKFIDYAGSDHMNEVFGSVQTLNRKLWDDYYKNYEARADKAYDAAFNTDFVGQALGRADTALDAADGAGRATAADMLSRYGQGQDGDQAAGSQALTQLGNVSRRLATHNQAKWSALDTKDALQTQMLDDYMKRMAGGVETANGVGMDAAQRKAAYLRYKAAKKARAMGGLQAVAGAILMVIPGGQAAGAALLAGGAAQGAGANSQKNAEEKNSQNRPYAGTSGSQGGYGYGY